MKMTPLLRALLDDEIYYKIVYILDLYKTHYRNYMMYEHNFSLDGLSVYMSDDKLRVMLYDSTIIRVFRRSTRPIDKKRTHIDKYFITYSPANEYYEVLPFIEARHRDDSETIIIDSSYNVTSDVESHFQYSVLHDSISVEEAMENVIRLRNLDLEPDSRIEIFPLVAHQDFIERIGIIGGQMNGKK